MTAAPGLAAANVCSSVIQASAPSHHRRVVHTSRSLHIRATHSPRNPLHTLRIRRSVATNVWGRRGGEGEIGRGGEGEPAESTAGTTGLVRNLVSPDSEPVSRARRLQQMVAKIVTRSTTSIPEDRKKKKEAASSTSDGIGSNSSSSSSAPTSPPSLKTLTSPFPVKGDLPLHPVLTVLAQRAKSNSRPGRRRDPFKVGLVVQGGGMRGVVSAGALTALDNLGMRDLFDATYGSSAGAMNLTYFLAGQPEGARAYIDDLSDGVFLDMKRFAPSKKQAARKSKLRGKFAEKPLRPALDLSVLLDDVMGTIKPLDWDAVITSPVPLKVVASNVDTCQAVLLEDFESVDDIKTCLRASAAVPAVATNEVVQHRGQRLVDAAVFEGVPLPSAIRDRCTHLLVLSTVTRDKVADADKGGFGIASYLAALIERAVKNTVLCPPFMKKAWQREAEMKLDGIDEASIMKWLQAASDTPLDPEVQREREGVFALTVFPDEQTLGGSNLTPLSCDVERLEMGLKAGYEAVYTCVVPIREEITRRRLVGPVVVAAQQAVVSLVRPLNSRFVRNRE